MAGNRDCRGRSCDNHPQTTFMTSFGCASCTPHNAPAFHLIGIGFIVASKLCQSAALIRQADDLEGSLE